MSTIRHAIAACVATALLPTSLLATSPVVAGMTGAEPVAGDAAVAPVLGPVATIGTGWLTPAVAVDPRGNVTVAWATDWWKGRIRAARRAAGGRWTRPVTIGHGTLPQVVADDRGVVTAAWQTNSRDRTTGVAVARRPVGGPWSDPRRLTTDRPAGHYWEPEWGNYGADALSLAAGADGAVMLAWQWGSPYRDVPLRIQAAYRPAGAPWGETVNLSPRDGSRDPSVGIDETGDVLLAYGERDRRLTVRRRVSGQGWTPATLLSGSDTGGPSSWRATASDASGMTVVYRGDTQSYGSVYAVTRPRGGRWQAPERLSEPEIGAFSPAVVTDLAGTVTATWREKGGRLAAVRRPLGEPWSAPTLVLTEYGRMADQHTVANANGDLLVSWVDYEIGLMAMHRPVDGDWSAVFRIASLPRYEAHYWTTRLYPNGDVAAAWQSGNDLGPIRFRRVSP